MPGMAVFQRTFSDVFTSHLVGPVVGLTPDALGPRNCGQFSPAGCVASALTAGAASAIATSTMNHRIVAT